MSASMRRSASHPPARGGGHVGVRGGHRRLPPSAVALAGLSADQVLDRTGRWAENADESKLRDWTTSRAFNLVFGDGSRVAIDTPGGLTIDVAIESRGPGVSRRIGTGDTDCTFAAPAKLDNRGNSTPRV